MTSTASGHRQMSDGAAGEAALITTKIDMSDLGECTPFAVRRLTVGRAGFVARSLINSVFEPHLSRWRGRGRQSRTALGL